MRSTGFLVAFAIAILVAVSVWWFFRLAEGGDQVEAVPDEDIYEETANELKAGKPFSFIMAEGSPLHGFNILQVKENGSCDYLFESVTSIQANSGPQDSDDPVWKRTTFHVDQGVLEKLRELLLEEKFFTLCKIYRDRSIVDGTQRILKVQIAGVTKTVRCTNYLPPQVRALMDFMHSVILEPRVGELEKAPRIDLKEAFTAVHGLESK